MIFTLLNIILCSYNIDQDNVPTLISFDLESITQEDINMLSDNFFIYNCNNYVQIEKNDSSASDNINSVNNGSYINSKGISTEDNLGSINASNFTDNNGMLISYDNHADNGQNHLLWIMLRITVIF